MHENKINKFSQSFKNMYTEWFRFLELELWLLFWGGGGYLFTYFFFYPVWISEKTYNAGRHSKNYLTNEFEKQENNYYHNQSHCWINSKYRDIY